MNRSLPDDGWYNRRNRRRNFCLWWSLDQLYRRERGGDKCHFFHIVLGVGGYWNRLLPMSGLGVLGQKKAGNTESR